LQRPCAYGKSDKRSPQGNAESQWNRHSDRISKRNPGVHSPFVELKDITPVLSPRIAMRLVRSADHCGFRITQSLILLSRHLAAEPPPTLSLTDFPQQFLFTINRAA
jgi:hypothetical protein